MHARWVTAVVGATLLSGVVPTPIASADDPLPPIRTAVNGDRSRTGCPAFAYSATLEDIAQTAVRPGDVRGGDLSGYDGTAKIMIGWGDPEAAAINDTYKNGAGGAISNCAFTEFGVGFHRNDSSEYDSVSIVFGSPAKAAAQAVTTDPSPTVVPTPASRQCPAGSPTPTVPAFGTCAPPTNQISVTFAKGFQWTVTATSTADIAGSCSYAATNPILPGSSRKFDIAPRGSASFTVPAPPPFSTYHVVVSCSGPFDGKTVEFGHVEQDVSA